MNDTSKGIKFWAEDDRPREKLRNKGAQALSDAELLALLIGSGTTKKSAVDLARELLATSNNNLNQLGKCNLSDLQKVKGIGLARAISVTAAMELGRRRQIEQVLERPKISATKDAATLLFPILQDLGHEAFCVLYLNTAHFLIKHELISHGGLSGTVADIRLIFKNALINNASKIIVAHNHPSGNRNPSDSDKKLTQKIQQSGQIMDIILLDHIIIAGQQYYSFADEGLL